MRTVVPLTRPFRNIILRWARLGARANRLLALGAARTAGTAASALSPVSELSNRSNRVPFLQHPLKKDAAIVGSGAYLLGPQRASG
jgi:hypothetical protein